MKLDFPFSSWDGGAYYYGNSEVRRKVKGSEVWGQYERYITAMWVDKGRLRLMDTASLISKASSREGIVLENGWYLLRRNLSLLSRMYRAGTLVEYLDGAWFLEDLRDGEKEISLEQAMVCRTYYHGVSLYTLECAAPGVFSARPVLSELPPVSVDPMVVHLSLESGEGRVCVNFGHCFLPLELFNW